MTRTPLTFELLQDSDALAALAPEWRALSARLATSLDWFATADYTRAYLSFFQPAQWFVVAIRDRDSGELCGVFPLQVFTLTKGEQRYRACKPVGVPFLPYVEFPVQGERRREVLGVLFNAVLRNRLGVDLVFLGPLHEQSPLYLALLEDLGRTASLLAWRYHGNAHTVDTRLQSFDDYARTRSSKALADARYNERRLSRQGDLRVTFSNAGDPANALRIDTLCRMSRERFGDKLVHASIPQWPEYIRHLVSSLASGGQAELASVLFDDHPIALGLSFCHKGRRNFFLTGFDPDYARYSPAKILLAHLVERTYAERGVLCLGAGSHPYKRLWATSVGELKCAVVKLNPDIGEALDAVLQPKNLYRLIGF
ncbi:GNAT family N-acetyltransferase [Halomonas ventosae]|uniref:CelD/BcsL family acetyltransferase involved in cellulose biosynthesis n=1 Tax=Halomonas ventosae TaxID=229007 RepID=A0A4R6HNV1_9GAMM|nr:GNAT family N-acetyltransferase [Halomonas ventosae]TDO10660.1 CelD/BcsL family acetyltransferase involved in cellulose biosynthesis [Halomonas ventosae]